MTASGRLCCQVYICSVQVVNVHLPIDRETGARRPFGFVEFESEAEADSALAATNHTIAGCDVSIHWPWLATTQQFAALSFMCNCISLEYFACSPPPPSQQCTDS